MSARTRAALLTSTGPSVAIEIAPRRVTLVSLARGPEGPVVAAHTTQVLSTGVVVPGFNATNIKDPAAVRDAIKRSLALVETRPRRIALVIPDAAVKVSLLRFDKVPPRNEDLEQLIRWQLKKAVPFKVEEAQLSFTPGIRLPEGGREFVTLVARRDIVQEYERVCLDLALEPGIVDIASLNLINAVLAARKRRGEIPDAKATSTDWLLVHVTSAYSTIAIVRWDELIFFRTRPSEGEGRLADIVHQSAMYYEDRLSGGGFAHVILAGASSAGVAEMLGPIDQIRSELEERLRTPVQAIDPRSAAGLLDRISAPPELLEGLASPIGVLLREHAA